MRSGSRWATDEHVEVEATWGIYQRMIASMDLDLVRDMSRRGVVRAALDLAESLDVRGRRAGRDALDAALGSFRA